MHPSSMHNSLNISEYFIEPVDFNLQFHIPDGVPEFQNDDGPIQKYWFCTVPQVSHSDGASGEEASAAATIDWSARPAVPESGN